MSHGTTWHLPKKTGGYYKRPFATTPAATANLITLLAEDQLTWTEIRDAINYDTDASAVAQKFVDEGHGHVIAATMLTIN